MRHGELPSCVAESSRRKPTWRHYRIDHEHVSISIDLVSGAQIWRGAVVGGEGLNLSNRQVDCVGRRNSR